MSKDLERPMDLANKVVVAMSGGVDSSVSAALLHQQGEDVVGVSMQVWDYRNNGGCSSKATCCAPDDFTDARMVAAKIGVPYYVFDFEKSFRKKVIDNFVDTYSRGLTPNPCIDCNNKVKFRELRDRAESFGCGKIATGHFARIKESSKGYHLLRGADAAKDQSYFLYGLSQAELANTIFPVGHLTKSEVRELAAEQGLVTAQKPESQDICFVSGNVQDFIVKLGGKAPGGNIVNREGEVLGTHSGVQNFTVGQRRGLGVSASQPLYVIEINPDEKTVVIGPKSQLERESFQMSELNFIDPILSQEYAKGAFPMEFDCIAQLRYRHAGVPVKVKVDSKDSCQVFFDGDWSTVSPGQAAVFYDQSNSEVLGGGRILL